MYFRIACTTQFGAPRPLQSIHPTRGWLQCPFHPGQSLPRGNSTKGGGVGGDDMSGAEQMLMSLKSNRFGLQFLMHVSLMRPGCEAHKESTL